MDIRVKNQTVLQKNMAELKDTDWNVHGDFCSNGEWDKGDFETLF